MGGSEIPLIPSVPLVSNKARDSEHPLEVGISSEARHHLVEGKCHG